MVTEIVTGTRRDWYKIDMVTDLIGYEPGHVIGGVAFSGLGGFATHQQKPAALGMHSPSNKLSKAK